MAWRRHNVSTHGRAQEHESDEGTDAGPLVDQGHGDQAPVSPSDEAEPLDQCARGAASPRRRWTSRYGQLAGSAWLPETRPLTPPPPSDVPLLWGRMSGTQIDAAGRTDVDTPGIASPDSP